MALRGAIAKFKVACVVLGAVGWGKISSQPPGQTKMQAIGFTHDSKNNLSVDWYTPPDFFVNLDLVFDLDPCQPEKKIPWIPAAKHYWASIDGLSLPWEGRVWLNPPYGKQTSTWLKKMHQHKNGVALVFARTDCAWYHDYASKADAILFMRGRMKFVDGLCKTGGSGAGCGSMLLAWGHDNVRALFNMRDQGHFVRGVQCP